MLTGIKFLAPTSREVLKQLAPMAAKTRKSLLECFSYSKRRKVLVFNGATVKIDKRGEEAGFGTYCTPNKDHLTRVSETPDSLIRTTSTTNTPLRYKNSVEKRKQRQRRRARISSSDDENDNGSFQQPVADLVITPADVGKDLFCGLPMSKRSKKEESVENEPSNIPRTRECCTDVNKWDEDELCHKPRRLLFKDGGDTTKDEEDTAEEDLELSHRKRSMRRRRPVGIIDESSESSEDLPNVRLTASGKML